MVQTFAVLKAAMGFHQRIDDEKAREIILKHPEIQYEQQPFAVETAIMAFVLFSNASVPVPVPPVQSTVAITQAVFSEGKSDVAGVIDEDDIALGLAIQASLEIADLSLPPIKNKIVVDNVLPTEGNEDDNGDDDGDYNDDDDGDDIGDWRDIETNSDLASVVDNYQNDEINEEENENMKIRSLVDREFVDGKDSEFKIIRGHAFRPRKVEDRTEETQSQRCAAERRRLEEGLEKKRKEREKLNQKLQNDLEIAQKVATDLNIARTRRDEVESVEKMEMRRVMREKAVERIVSTEKEPVKEVIDDDIGDINKEIIERRRKAQDAALERFKNSVDQSAAQLIDKNNL